MITSPYHPDSAQQLVWRRLESLGLLSHPDLVVNIIDEMMDTIATAPRSFIPEWLLNQIRNDAQSEAQHLLDRSRRVILKAVQGPPGLREQE